MLRFFILAAVVAVVAGCKPPTPPTTPKGRLAEILQSNAKLVGYVYSADQPYVLADFHNGNLIWRSDPKSTTSAEGRVQVFNFPDKTCIGFEQKSPSMPARPAERYLLCEASEAFQHRNHLPRSQDFFFRRGDVFLEYQPPEGTGFPEVYYAGERK